MAEETTAEALWFSSARTAELRREQVHPPGPGEIQVAGLCALISAGSEMNLYRGEADLPDLSPFPTAAGRLPFPVKFGYQEVGEVTAVGPGTSLRVGATVLCHHPHQTVFTIDEQLVSVVPEDVPPARAAFATLMGVAQNACMTTPPVIGDCVAVSGLGVIGALTAAFARRVAARLILVEPSPQRRKAAAWVGADAVVDPAEAAETIMELTGGRGVDLFFEASGAPAALQSALQLTGTEGTVTVASWYGTRQVNLSLPEFHLRRLKLVSTGPALPPGLAPRWDKERVRQVAWRHLREFEVDQTLLTHRIPFDGAAEGYRILDDPSGGAIAVLLEHERLAAHRTRQAPSTAPTTSRVDAKN